MTQHAIISVTKLDANFVLAPERYDPRRHPAKLTRIMLGDVAEVVHDMVSPVKADKNKQFLVLDTGEVREGIIRTNKNPVSTSNIGSAKKRVLPGDVIISRLRPYLRQVAYVDHLLLNAFPNTVEILCSTEFFVLRSLNSQSIAFLVPYLLSEGVQKMLSASQEGGHHPRFNIKTLQTVPIPDDIIANRDKVSSEVETAANWAGRADLLIQNLIGKRGS